ncbi:MAG: hypothetical protein JW925_09230 [Syntrophaceae bacterium]|nr:hypothetical protein [Syntrophaceae bacterium]
MEEKLKGFRDYTDYLYYAEVYLFWMNRSAHKKTYDFLLSRQGDINPISYLLQMSSLAHSQR